MKHVSSSRTLFSDPGVFSRWMRLSCMAFIMTVLYAQTLDYLTGLQFAMHSASVGIFTILVFWCTEQTHEGTFINGVSE